MRRFCGKGFICIGDAHRFVDPIFSFGLYLSLKEAQFAPPAVRAYLEGAHRDDPNPFAEHQLFCEKGIDVLEDMIDTFWEHPANFAFMLHRRSFDEMIDIFAGRIWERQPSRVVIAMRSLLERERFYDNEDKYSVPIGSRFRLERARVWRADASLPCTEAWMRE